MSDQDNWQHALKHGAEALGFCLTPLQFQRLVQYLSLLQKWNHKINLTAIRDPMDMVTKHLLDALAILPHIEGRTILDVGTGGGLPGIPLAIMLPQLRFTLLDSHGKKVHFLTQVIASLGLKNVTLVHQRVEDYHPEQCYDCVLSRAFTSLSQMITYCATHAGQNGVFLAMKGTYPQQELVAVQQQGIMVDNVIQLNIPGLAAQRHLVVLRKKLGE